MAFLGTYEHILDAKHRLTIPSVHRGRFADGLTLVQGIEACIEFWIPAEYAAYVEQTIAGRSRLLPETRQLERWFGGRAATVFLDSANRVVLPLNLMTHAGLRKEVTVSSGTRCLELWDRAAFKAMDAQLTADIDDLTKLIGSQG